MIARVGDKRARQHAARRPEVVSQDGSSRTPGLWCYRLGQLATFVVFCQAGASRHLEQLFRIVLSTIKNGDRVYPVAIIGISNCPSAMRRDSNRCQKLADCTAPAVGTQAAGSTI